MFFSRKSAISRKRLLPGFEMDVRVNPPLRASSSWPFLMSRKRGLSGHRGISARHIRDGTALKANSRGHMVSVPASRSNRVKVKPRQGQITSRSNRVKVKSRHGQITSRSNHVNVKSRHGQITSRSNRVTVKSRQGQTASRSNHVTVKSRQGQITSRSNHVKVKSRQARCKRPTSHKNTFSGNRKQR